jgi:hypothetical protein
MEEPMTDLWKAEEPPKKSGLPVRTLTHASDLVPPPHKYPPSPRLKEVLAALEEARRLTAARRRG